MVSQSAIKLIVGLRNPGPEYERTRHNAGSWLVERFADQHDVSLKADKKCCGVSGRFNLNGHDVFLLLPNTYMNESGRAVQAAANFYKLKPEEILIVHDELDLSPGTIKFKHSGGHGGNNGVRDTIKALGSNDFYRLRVGVGKPQHSSDTVDYVLHAPSKSDQTLIDNAIADALSVLPEAITGHIEKAMKELHTN
tara:strand:- start:103750 stop:104334 length:585 start_codon:yes stop_codon:yes gene_type:complete